MGYKTPNIDRVATEGIVFTDYYAATELHRRPVVVHHRQRPAPHRHDQGRSARRHARVAEGPIATIATAAQDHSATPPASSERTIWAIATSSSPPCTALTSSYGNLYHLNAEEEPELPDYPKDPAFREKYAPRGVLDCKASDKDDPTVDPRFGKVGRQVCTDTGPLTKKRMVTIDDDVANRAVDFIQRQKKAGKPFFVWVNFTHMHFRTHAKPESIGQSGRWQSPYHDTMIDHDRNVGQVLKALDDLGIAGNTIVMYSTDNGPHMNSWPDAGMTPFRSEKNSNWEGAYRVPAMVRWPGKIKPGSVSNEMVAHHDWLPTLLAAAGDTAGHGKAAQGVQGRRHELQGPPRRL